MNVYFYTVAKAASDYVAFRIMRPLSQVLGLQHRDLAHEVFQSGKSFEEVVAAHREEFELGGRYFGALRHGPIPDHDYGPDDKVVLHVRDPRDCLTSLYFSVVYSHPVPEGPGRERFLAHRAAVSSRSIDSNCLRQGGGYAQIFQNYVDFANRTPGVLISRYEDMVSDFERWLLRLVDHLGVPSSHPVLTQIINGADFEVAEEDVRRHKRRVVPGDFMEKLQPETIEELNRMFAGALQRFEYPLVTPRYTLWRRQA